MDRHHFTDYQDQLEGAYGEDFLFGELHNREIKGTVNGAVDDFITAHRRVG